MLDNRSSVSSIAGGINFKSGDISGTAAKTADDRASQGTEYFRQDGFDQEAKEPFIDRSMELRASLASLALINASYVIRSQKQKAVLELDDALSENNTEEELVKKIEHQPDNDEADEN